MTQDTLQVVYKTLVVAFVVVFVGIVGALIASIFVFGDGEAQKIISDLTPAVLGAFGTMGLMFLGHQGVSALQTMTAAGIAQQQQMSQQPQTTQQPVSQQMSSGAQGHPAA